MKAQVVSFRCVLKNNLGQVISTSVNQNILSVGGIAGVPLQALTEGLQNLKAGERRKIALPAAKAYGFYDLEKLKRISLDLITEEITVGESVRLDKDSDLFRVIAIDSEYATLDANHPLAGQDLVFEVEATQVRQATAEEVQHLVEIPQASTFH